MNSTNNFYFVMGKVKDLSVQKRYIIERDMNFSKYKKIIQLKYKKEKYFTVSSALLLTVCILHS